MYICKSRVDTRSPLTVKLQRIYTSSFCIKIYHTISNKCRCWNHLALIRPKVQTQHCLRKKRYQELLFRNKMPSEISATKTSANKFLQQEKKLPTTSVGMDVFPSSCSLCFPFRSRLKFPRIFPEPGDLPSHQSCKSQESRCLVGGFRTRI